MGWPSKIYCATKTLGVYYTSNFNGTDQPTWAAINGGLPATDVRQFALDPYLPDDKQYLMLEATRTLYKRILGTWTAILTNAQAAIACGVPSMDLRWFCTDSSVAGRLWVSAHYDTGGSWKWLYALWSDDYGATWTGTAGIEHTTLYDNYSNISNPQAYGDTVFIGTGWASGGNFIWYSTDKGANWTVAGLGAGVLSGPLALNALQPTLVYRPGGKTDNAGNVTALANLDYVRADGVWFAAAAAGHQRSIMYSNIYATVDSWVNVNAPSAISPVPENIAPWSGADEDQMIVGLVLHDDPGQPDDNPHVIGILYGEADVTAVGIAGTNCETTPFTDSIPDTCGGVSVGGIAAIADTPSAGPTPPPGETITPPGGTPVTLGGSGNVQAVTMPGYLGDERGEPLPGDRGAWKTDTQAHAKLHAQDIKDEVSKYHLDPHNANDGDIPTFNNSTGLFENAQPVVPTIDAANVTYTPTTPTDWDGDADPGNVDDALDQLAERTDDLEAASHAPVTLGAGSDAALALSGQQLTLTLPAPPSVGKYRYLTYSIVAGVFEFICDVDGYPVYTLEDLE
jgi:hypothetical protein